MDVEGRQDTRMGDAMTAERLREILKYDPSTGVFSWRVKFSRTSAIGCVAGAVYMNGRRYITIATQRYFAHRLAWLYVHGRWPNAQIDHKNMNRDDNRIENLREATNQQNIANRRVLPSNLLGIKGVGISSDRKRKPQRYRARIRVNDRLIHLGYFSTPELASAAYAEAAVKYFGEFARSA